MRETFSLKMAYGLTSATSSMLQYQENGEGNTLTGTLDPPSPAAEIEPRTPHPRAAHSTRWPWKLSNSTCEEEVDMEMQQLLNVLRQDQPDGRDSSCSLGGSSNTDSGHGASDDGLPPPPAPGPDPPPKTRIQEEARQLAALAMASRMAGKPCPQRAMPQPPVRRTAPEDSDARIQSPERWQHKNGYMPLMPIATQGNTVHIEGQVCSPGVLLKTFPGGRVATRGHQSPAGGSYEGDMVVDTETGCPGAGEIQYTALTVGGDNSLSRRKHGGNGYPCVQINAQNVNGRVVNTVPRNIVT